mmetsp:Transcript_10371/g.23707  ORF Transcript_10371/g.23707 Transcript_10371/m.23707 type:complete len:189 (-) Transcript_10371:154-720(-)
MSSQAEGKLRVMGPVLLVFSVVASVYIGSVNNGWTWFSWHPTAMIFAYVAMSGNAALIKKVGGKTNTEIHGYVMALAALLACFGWYVIYSNKDKFGRPHNVTWHAWSGLVVLGGFVAMAPFSYLALNPESGMYKTNAQIRMAHKWGGRLLTSLSWFTCFLGWMTMQQSFISRAAFAVPLLVSAPYVLL